MAQLPGTRVPWFSQKTGSLSGGAFPTHITSYRSAEKKSSPWQRCSSAPTYVAPFRINRLPIKTSAINRRLFLSSSSRNADPVQPHSRLSTELHPNMLNVAMMPCMLARNSNGLLRGFSEPNNCWPIAGHSSANQVNWCKSERSKSNKTREGK
jgi:hypothetical protein